MALDHARDFFTNTTVITTDLASASPALFLTRWVTHLCAPAFCFLAGLGAFLYQSAGRSKRELSWFLWTRGLWLVFLELTWLNWFGWSLSLTLHFFRAGVIWSLGWGMVALAALIWLPRWALACFGLAMICGHNLCDHLTPDQFGAWSGLWRVVYAGDIVNLPGGVQLDVEYRLVPWIGVMAVGYAFGPVMLMDAPRRRQWLVRFGLAVCALFVMLRFANGYGDPDPWSRQKNPLFTFFSFINCHKYPPSLEYLLMTLGPALLLLALFDRPTPTWLRPVLIFGRVPLFFFLLHVPLLHLGAVLLSWLEFGTAAWLIGPPDVPKAAPPGAGLGLPAVYAAWFILLLVLYPLCKGFADFKRRKKSPWLSYL